MSWQASVHARSQAARPRPFVVCKWQMSDTFPRYVPGGDMMDKQEFDGVLENTRRVAWAIGGLLAAALVLGVLWWVK